MTSFKNNQKDVAGFYDNLSMKNEETNDVQVIITSKADDVSSSPEHANQETSFINPGTEKKEESGRVSDNSKTSINFDEIYNAEKLTDSLSVAPNKQMNRAESLNRPLRARNGILGQSKRKGIHRDSVFLPDEDNDDYCEKELVLKIRKTMPIKDFMNDIRGNRDIEKFLIDPVVMLDVAHRSLDSIIGGLMEKLRKDLDVDEAITAEAEKAFFTLNQGQSLGASVDNLRETIEGIKYKPEGAEAEQSWVTAVCSLPMLKKSHVGIARLRHPLNLGSRNEEVQFVIAVIAPKKEKFTKNAVEIGRTFSTLMMNCSFRHDLVESASEKEFRDAFGAQCSKYKKAVNKTFENYTEAESAEFSEYSFVQFGRGVRDDFRRRLPHYWSDFRDGWVGKHSIQKVISTVFFLYFACLLPDIAFGTVYEKETGGLIGVRSCIIAQTMAGFLFAFFGGQPMLVMVTTAPLALYVKVIKLISDSYVLDFRAMYAMTGIWNCIFLVLEGMFNTSKLMKYSSRSTEEIFEIFIALAFAADAIKATITNFKKNYNFLTPTPHVLDNSSISLALRSSAATNSSDSGYPADDYLYQPANSVLFLFLMLATLWVGWTLIGFDESHFLSATKREILADYALPIAVVCLSFVGSYLFRQIPLEQFVNNINVPDFSLPPIGSLPATAHLAAVGLGFCLSCLFFVDQNIAAALINAPENKLRKGSAYHWDLVVVGVLNIPLSIFSLPWVHGAIPHSPLHLKALADVEYSVSNVGTGHEEVVKVRETRLTTIFSHILIGLSLLIIPVLQYVPVAVLQGVFLYLSLTSFHGNQMFDRMLLVFTEGSSYPPNHYVRKVPQRKLHLFTLFQVIQLIVLSVFGFIDIVYLKMVFPVVFLLLLPFRHKVLPRFIEEKYLTVLDS